MAVEAPGASHSGSAFSPCCVCWAPLSPCPPRGLSVIELSLPWTGIACIYTLHQYLKELRCPTGCHQKLTLSPLWHCMGKPVEKHASAKYNCFHPAVLVQLSRQWFLGKLHFKASAALKWISLVFTKLMLYSFLSSSFLSISEYLSSLSSKKSIYKNE